MRPDFTYTQLSERPEDLDYIHRTLADAKIYFVINRNQQQATQDCTFRVTGKQPEIFDPVTGRSRPATAFRQTGGCTTLPLQFDRFGSYFVVFRKPISAEAAGRSDTNFPRLDKLQSFIN